MEKISVNIIGVFVGLVLFLALAIYARVNAVEQNNKTTLVSPLAKSSGGMVELKIALQNTQDLIPKSNGSAILTP